MPGGAHNGGMHVPYDTEKFYYGFPVYILAYPDEAVGVGITTLLSIHVFLNIAVVTNLIPCTGISLPFFSYGGTALLMQLGEMGIILSISRDIPTKKAR